MKTARWLAMALLLSLPLESTGVAQERRTVWDGVYSAAQAGRGREQFNANCSGCHQGERRLDGDDFLQDWGEDYLISLFTMIRNGMPARDPGSLSDQTYLDIVTYLLEINGFPSGSDELRTDALGSVRVESADGPGPVPDFALVQVSGCLSRSPEGAWIVGSATAPVRTRQPSASSAEELQALIDAPLGDGTFELIYVFPAPDDMVGHKVEARGFLIRSTDPDRINVSSLASIAAECVSNQ